MVETCISHLCSELLKLRVLGVCDMNQLLFGHAQLVLERLLRTKDKHTTIRVLVLCLENILSAEPQRARPWAYGWGLGQCA
jgi:hypothetical protein